MANWWKVIGHSLVLDTWGQIESLPPNVTNALVLYLHLKHCIHALTCGSMQSASGRTLSAAGRNPLWHRHRFIATEEHYITMLSSDWLIDLFTSRDTFAFQFLMVKDAMESVYIGLLDIVYCFTAESNNGLPSYSSCVLCTQCSS